jgi:hypothetical protein
MAVLAASLEKLEDARVVPLDAREQGLGVLLFDRSEGMDQG